MLKHAVPALLGLLPLTLSTLRAYPTGDPGSWTWKSYADHRFQPAQISACTDPDGRLRTLFVDTLGFRYYTENGVQHRVCHAVMQSFRAFGDGHLISEFEDARLGDFTSTVGTEDDVSWAAAQARRRTSVFSVTGAPGTLVIGGGYRRMLETDHFGDTFFPSSDYFGPPRPLAHRAVLRSGLAPTGPFPSFETRFSGSQDDLLATAVVPGPVENRTFLKSVYRGIRLTHYRDGANPPTYFETDISDILPVGWGVDRVITGGSLAVTPDGRDFYAFITSYKYLATDEFTTEARVFRVRTATTTSLDADGDPEIDLESITSVAVDGRSYPPGTAASATFAYPTILLTSANEPKWVVYEDGHTKNSWLTSRAPVTAGSAVEKTRAVSNGYTNRVSFGTASGPAAALDRRDNLHLAYQYTFNGAQSLVYFRETESGFSSPGIWHSVKCVSAPALTIGPGEYPYIVFNGNPDGGSYNSLVLWYPQEMQQAYKGDYEDRDKDGLIGLLEKATGSSDLAANPDSFLSIHAITHTDGLPRARLQYRVAASATRVPGQTVHLLADGNDTIRIEPSWSRDLNTFATGDFIVPSPEGPVRIPGRTYRTVWALDSVPLRNIPTQLFRLEVTRIQGAP